MTDNDTDTVERFVSLATKENRLRGGVDGADIEKLFRNLNLINNDGKLTRTALLLFGKETTRFSHTEGNLCKMVDGIVNLLKAKYLMSPTSYEGMLRVEILEISEKTSQETTTNALTYRK